MECESHRRAFRGAGKHVRINRSYLSGGVSPLVVRTFRGLTPPARIGIRDSPREPSMSCRAVCLLSVVAIAAAFSSFETSAADKPVWKAGLAKRVITQETAVWL